jgi:hypothetical protein
MDRSSEIDTEDVTEEIENSSSEEEEDIEISDVDEPEFNQYVPYSLDSGCGNGFVANISLEPGQPMIK